MKIEGFFQIPAIYPIANIDTCSETISAPLEFIGQILAAKPQILQLRCKMLDQEALCRMAQEAIEMRDQIFAQSSVYTKIIINDLPQLCHELNADGVHIGQEDGSPREAREIIGPNKLLGLSTHNIEQVVDADDTVVDYLGFGPIFSSDTKSGHAPSTGLEKLRMAVAKSTLPIVAIGGINEKRICEVFKCGLNHGIGAEAKPLSAAIISDLAKADNVPEKMETYREIISSIHSQE